MALAWSYTYFLRSFATSKAMVRLLTVLAHSTSFFWKYFDYYLIDEVMAVGDAVFKRKSQQVFNERLEKSNRRLVRSNWLRTVLWTARGILLVIPIVTPEEMAAVDAAAPEPEATLIDRAGRAVARTALEMLGGAYGRRVVVVADHGEALGSHDHHHGHDHAHAHVSGH